MLLRLFLLFTLVPLAELLILLRIGAAIGLAPTLLLVVGTGFAGAWLARREGLRSWMAVQAELAAGRLPAEELLHSLMILVAGVVLVTPGVLTDIAGLLLLVRPVRRALMRRVRGGLESRLGSATGTGGPDGVRFFRWTAGRGEWDSEPGRAGGTRPDKATDPEEGTGRRPRVIEL